VFHGEKDWNVNVINSRNMVSALERLGRHVVYTHGIGENPVIMSDKEIAAEIAAGADLLYTEWPGKEHAVWDESYDYPFLLPWVFSQSKAGTLTTVSRDFTTSPMAFSLHQNYPNPFNSATEIVFSLPEDSYVTLAIFNALGRKIETLEDGAREAGNYGVKWDGAGFPSGVYFYRLEMQGLSKTMKMLLMK
jgi:hypothetical protein